MKTIDEILEFLAFEQERIDAKASRLGVIDFYDAGLDSEGAPSATSFEDCYSDGFTYGDLSGQREIIEKIKIFIQTDE